MTPTFNTIILPTRSQPDTLVAIFILKYYGKEKFPGIENAEIKVWQTMPEGETEETLEAKGFVLLDFGGGKFDHHNKEVQTTASALVSEYLEVIDNPSLAKLLEYAKRDDFFGKGTISTDPIDRALGLSGLINSMNRSMPNNPEKVPEYIIPLLWAHHAEEMRRTQELPQEFAKAVEAGKAHVFNVKQRDKKFRVVLIASDNASMAGFLRSQLGGRHDVVAQMISSGHLNILTRPTKRVDLRALAAWVRVKELGITDISKVNMWNMAKTGMISEAPHWYYDPATNSVLNGGLNPVEIAPTKIPFQDWLIILEEGLSEKYWTPMRKN
jgi:hypothetical protein